MEGYTNNDNWTGGQGLSREEALRAALHYADLQVPVFPLVPGGKAPVIPKSEGGRGHLDATADPRKITAWWTRYPGANIGIPCGEITGRVVLDLDTYKAGAWSLEDVRSELGELPRTRTVLTGSGGLQLHFRYPTDVDPTVQLRNGIPENGLGPGVCVKSDGGYVVAPGSITEGPYEVIDAAPPATCPAWLVDALRKPQKSRQDRTRTNVTHLVNMDLAGPAIPEGERNWTLYRIGCSMRARGFSEARILDGLREINDARGRPPTDDREVAKVAKSASRHAPGNAHEEVSEEVLEALDAITEDIMRREWTGVGGKSERDTTIALLRLARMHGTMIPAGVRVSVDVRTLALMASVSKRSLLDNRKNGERVRGIISRLKARGVIRSDNARRRGREAGAMVLLTPAQGCTTQPLGASLGSTENPCGATLRAPLSAPRLRWSRPLFDRSERVGTIYRLGKSKGEIIDHLEAAGGTVRYADLAHALSGEAGGDSSRSPRVRDLRRRHLEPLEEEGVVECSGDTVSLTRDWLNALNERREIDGEIADHRRDMARYERERTAYRERDKNKPDPAPTTAQMDSNPRKEARLKRHRIDVLLAQGMRYDFAARAVIGADGYVEDLDPCEAEA